jgi:hypothetical protein
MSLLSVKDVNSVDVDQYDWSVPSGVPHQRAVNAADVAAVTAAR